MPPTGRAGSGGPGAAWARSFPKSRPLTEHRRRQRGNRSMTDGQRVALVTGAGNGIGRATSRYLAGGGWTVVAADLEPGPAEPGIRPVQADVSDESDVQRLVAG